MTSGAARVDDLRAAFEDARGFTLDGFQRQALDALDAGRSVLVAAPTGSGKTVVAEYAMTRALASSTKAFYTTPLKALSNQKYADLVREHGAGRVGLLTGDNSINGDASLVVMTTEVLRNMIYSASPALARLRYVVLDEVHYLQDPYRGAVWEEVIIHLAPDVELVCLSATVSNAEEVAAWLQTVRGDTQAVIEERRPVDLQHLYLAGQRGRDTLLMLPTFVGGGRGGVRPNPDAGRLDARPGRSPGRGRPVRRLRTPSRVETVELLAIEGMLPAISFVFSRAGCDQAVTQCLGAGLRLTDVEERHAIREIAESRTSSIADDDLDTLGYDEWLAGLEAGVAAHHAGMVPPMKEAVEMAFARGLVKVVFATETLALGINMPARAVVIEKLSKFTGERHEFLTPGEYTQLTGRAGRRGIDEVGYAIACWSPFVPFDQVAGLASKRTYALTSSFRPTYNMAANLVRRYTPDVAHHLLNLSFAQFHADRDVVAVERRLERSRALRDHHRAAAAGPGDVGEYRRLLHELETERRERGSGRRVAAALEGLRPGDVIASGRHGGRVLVLAHDRHRGSGPRVLALTPARELVRLGAADFHVPPARLAHVELPQPYAPRNPGFRRVAAERLRSARLRDAAVDAGAGAREEQLAATVAAHPVAADPDREHRLEAAASAARLDRDVARFERRVRSRSGSLARQFDRVLRVLEKWGYVDGWSLTDAGHLLARLYTESDLLAAEALRQGLLDDLDPPLVAALVSCLTYERRGRDTAPAGAPRRDDCRELTARAAKIERIRHELARDEDDAGLPETRCPDAGLAAAILDWARGQELVAVLDRDEVTAGDFVRHAKQCIDLLRQVAQIAPAGATARSAASAVDACLRGVVAASSMVPA